MLLCDGCLARLEQWLKEHKEFLAKRLHAGGRAINQLAKHMESGACCDQFDALLALKKPDAPEPSTYVNELLFRDPLRPEPKHDPWLESTGSTGWILENGTLLRPVGGEFVRLIRRQSTGHRRHGEVHRPAHVGTRLRFGAADYCNPAAGIH